MDPIESDQKSCLVIVGKNWRPFFRSWKASLSSPTTPTGPNASFTLQSNIPNSVFAQTLYAIRSIRSIGNIPDCNYVGFPLSGVVVSALKSPALKQQTLHECYKTDVYRKTKNDKQKKNKDKQRQRQTPLSRVVLSASRAPSKTTYSPQMLQNKVIILLS